MIVDSNLVILSNTPAFPGLRRLIGTSPVSVSAISQLEVLGYHKLTVVDKTYFEMWFHKVPVLPITTTVITAAIGLRQQRKMSLGDAIIAATALELNQELYTHNVKDFAWITGLTVIDPIAAGDPP
jgi:toxin FitB